MVVMKEGSFIRIAKDPSLYILKVVYGFKDVTDIVKKLAESQGGNRVTIAANNGVFTDTWPGVLKSCVAVYNYEDGLPRVSICQEHQTIDINYASYSKWNESRQWKETDGLEIIAAVYGTLDVTEKCRERVNNGKLEIKADNSTFGDPWFGICKTLVVVYRYGSEDVKVKVVAEHNELKISYSEIKE